MGSSSKPFAFNLPHETSFGKKTNYDNIAVTSHIIEINTNFYYHLIFLFAAINVPIVWIESFAIDDYPAINAPNIAPE